MIPWQAVENEFAPQFKAFDRAAADAWLAGHPGSADTTTQEGRSYFRAALTSNNYPTVKAFLEAGADVNATVNDKPGSTTLLSRAVSYCQAESLRAMLEYHPDLGRYDSNHRPALYYALLPDMYIPEEEQSASRNMSISKPSDYHFARCATQLLAAGALEARDELGYTPLLHVFAHDPFKGKTPVSGMTASERAATRRYVKLLQENGADVMARTPDGRTVWDIQNKRANTFTSALRDELAIEQGALQRALETSPPDELLQKTKRVMHLGVLLGANALQPLTSMQYWQKHGGAEAGLAFVEKLQAFVPPHLAHLRDRFDCAELLREAELPREGTVTVEYVHGGTGLGRA